MNTTYLKAAIKIGILVVAISAPLLMFGADFRAGDQPSIQSDEKIEDDLYIAGGSVSSTGTLGGDIFAAGGNIVISGGVKGDIFAAGGSITILSNAPDDVRVGGGNILVQGTVEGDLLAGGGQVQIASSRIGGDALIGAGTVRLDAPVAGDVKVGGGSVFINSAIAGNVYVDADKLTLGSAAKISGDLTYRSPKEAVLEDGAKVEGNVSYEPRKARAGSKKGFLLGAISLFFVAKFFALMASALVLGLVFRRYSKALVEDAIERPLAGIGRGLVTIIVLPVASILLIASLIGAPLGIIGVVSFIGTIFFMWIIAPIVLGTILHRWIKRRDVYAVSWKTILLGSVAFMLLSLFPIIGCIIQAIIMLLGLGAAMKLKWAVVNEWR